jgi:hypothetical protein
MIRLQRALVAAFLLALSAFAWPAYASDVTVSGTVNFAALDGSADDADHTVNGVFTVTGNLTINGSILCIDDSGRESACAMSFNVGHDLIINAGGVVFAENRTGTGSGAPVTFTVGHDFVMHGAAGTLPAAIVSTDSTSSSGSNGGNVTVTVGNAATIESGATIDSGSANAAAGAISITAGGHIDASGNVLAGPSRTILSTRLTDAILSGGTGNQSGGAIALKSTSFAQPAVNIGSNANIVSQGQTVNAGPVLIEGCGVVVDGLVAAVAYQDATARVVIRSGKTIDVDGRDLGVVGATLGRNGRIRCDAPTGTALNHTVDLFAFNDVTVLGPDPAASSLFAISGTPGPNTSKSDGATIRLISLSGGVTASGNVILDGRTASGDDGGNISIASHGDINLDHAVVSSTGDSNTSNPNRGGGTISVRSYSGNVVWTSGNGDVRPTGSSSGLAASEQGVISITACGSITLSGSTFPTNGPPVGVFPGQVTSTCTPGAPSLPAGEPALPQCCNVITITNPSVATGTAGVAFSQSFTQSGAIGTATFSTTSTLPAGLTLSPGGLLSGTPTQTGTFPIVVTVTDSNGCTGTGAVYNLTIQCQTITVTAPSANSGTADTPFSAAFTQSGALGTATFSLASGALPNGLTLAANGTLSGTPLQTGSFTVTVKVTDSNGCTGTSASYTLTIACQVITVSHPAVMSGTVGVPFSQQYTQSGGIGTTTFSLSGGTLPSGMTLAADGTLSGTPAQPGSFPITVTVTDSNGCTGSNTFTLTIACQVITVTNPPNAAGTVGTPFSASFAQSGGIGAVTFSLASGALPNGVALASNGTLSGTPTQPGTFTITVTATDANGCSGTGTSYTLTIACQNITATNPSVSSGTVGTPFSASFAQSGGIGTVTFSLASGTLPNGVTLASNGTLSGTPTQPGTFTVTVTATDANGCSGTSTPYTLTIACQSISVTNPSVTTGTVDTPFSQNFTESGAIGVANFSLASGTLPAGLTLSTTGILSGTPQAPGTFTITVIVTDANGCSGTSAPYTLTVGCQTITVNNPASHSATYGTPFSASFGQSGVGTHGPAVFSIASGALPAGVTLSASGVLSGSPSQTGSFTITVKVTDANGCSGTGASYTLNVGPRVVGEAYTDVANTQLAGGGTPPSTPTVVASAVSANDSSDTAITYALVTGPSHGTMTSFNPDGTFLYTPDAGNLLTDSFSYTATSNGVSTLGTATISFSAKVWYVDSGFAGSADGRSNTPFTTLTAAAGVATSASDIIYVSKGSGPTTGSYTMIGGQQLIGAGATLAAGGVLTVTGAAANTPTLTGTLTLASNVTVAGIDVSTGSAPAITGSGVAGINVSARNVTTTTGVPLTLAGTGNSGTVALTQVNANGASSAIDVSNFNGGLTVSGDGGATSNGSGGTIQNTTGHAVSLSSITGAGVSLRYLNITNSGANGINAVGVANLTVNHCNISDAAGDTSADDGIGLTNASGAVVLTNDSITGAPHRGLSLDNLNTNLASLTVTGTTIDGAAGDDGASVQMRGTSVLTTGTISGSTFSNNFATGLQVSGANTANVASLTVQNNTFRANSSGMDFDLSNAASMTLNVLTNTLNNHQGTALNLFSNSTTIGGTMRAKVQGNLIGTQGVFNSGTFFGDGIRAVIFGGTHGLLTIDGNVIREVPNARGIDVDAEAFASGNSVSVKITNNQVVRPSGTNGDIGCGPGVPCPGASIAVVVDKNAAAAESLCTTITGNSAYDPTSWAAGSESAFYLARRSLQTFNLEGNTSQTPSQNILGANTVTNLTTPGAGDFTDESGNVVVVAPGSCGTFP